MNFLIQKLLILLLVFTFPVLTIAGTVVDLCPPDCTHCLKVVQPSVSSCCEHGDKMMSGSSHNSGEEKEERCALAGLSCGPGELRDTEIGLSQKTTMTLQAVIPPALGELQPCTSPPALAIKATPSPLLGPPVPVYTLHCAFLI